MLKHLNAHEMIGLSGPWVGDAKRRTLFLSIPEIAPLHPKLVEIHAELVAAEPPSGAVSPAMQALLDEEKAVDDVHDPLARAVAAGLEADRAHALAAEPPDLARAKQAEAVTAELFPDGMSIVNAAYVAESGNTARVASRLAESPMLAPFLKSIPVRGKATTLLDTADRWVDVGAKLGKLERKREELEAKEAVKPLDKRAVSAIRSRWIRLANAVLTSLELSDAPTEAIETIRGPLRKAAERAGKRYGGAVADVEPTSPAAPTQEK